MLEGAFGEKCIIMQFLMAEKTGKALNAEIAGALRKDLRKIREEPPAKKLRHRKTSSHGCYPQG
jgi:hypothetical protein